MLDDYQFNDSGGEQLRLQHAAVNATLSGLNGADEDSWYAAITTATVHAEGHLWARAVLAHIAADQQSTVTRTLALDYLCLGLLLTCVNDPSSSDAERTVARKSLSSGYLSIAESYISLGLQEGAMSYLRLALAATDHLDDSNYKTQILNGLAVLAREGVRHER